MTDEDIDQKRELDELRDSCKRDIEDKIYYGMDYENTTRRCDVCCDDFHESEMFSLPDPETREVRSYELCEDCAKLVIKDFEDEPAKEMIRSFIINEFLQKQEEKNAKKNV